MPFFLLPRGCAFWSRVEVVCALFPKGCGGEFWVARQGELGRRVARGQVWLLGRCAWRDCVVSERRRHSVVAALYWRCGGTVMSMWLCLAIIGAFLMSAVYLQGHRR